ncbi:hypothetical protein BpHYR1_009646 [Brachionus plicatilis]|uniref:Uncharacterized protein n=1 Tax=Brachionus plicatilis TaxID=10195 RepID=A0A3M7S9E5_BRAPC|nr:hypothetical protein BpHYR1_009646 [Brachionus plicatilis]
MESIPEGRKLSEKNPTLLIHSGCESGLFSCALQSSLDQTALSLNLHLPIFKLVFLLTYSATSIQPRLFRTSSILSFADFEFINNLFPCGLKTFQNFKNY